MDPNFFCTAPAGWLDGKNVVFGKVVEGMTVVKTIEAFGTGTGHTTKPVVIAACGELIVECRRFTEKQGDTPVLSSSSAPVFVALCSVTDAPHCSTLCHF